MEPISGVSGSEGLEWDLRTCISDQFLHDSDAGFLDIAL